MNCVNYFIMAAALFAGVAGAAVKVADVAEAKKKAAETNSDYVVLVYGDEWDVFGQRYKTRIWDSQAALSRLDAPTLVTTMAIPENPGKEETDKQKELNKAFSGRISSVPQVSFFDKTGFCYATLYGTALPKNASELSVKLQQIQQLRKRRDALVAKSAQVSSPREKGRLLGQAAEIPGLNRPKPLVDQLKKVDPEDLSGYQKRLNFNIYDYHKYLNEPKDVALKVFAEVLSSNAYTVEQKQLMLGLQSTVLRKHKGSERELKETLQKMHDLNPSSPLGKAALNAMKAYVK